MMKGLMVRKNIYVIATFAVLLAFQNCSQILTSGAGSDASSASASSSSSGQPLLPPVTGSVDLNQNNGGDQGGGVGYDGKISYRSYLSSGTCSDGSKVEAEIEGLNMSYQQVRKDCESIPALTLNPQSVRIAGTQNQLLLYENTIYQSTIGRRSQVPECLSSRSPAFHFILAQTSIGYEGWYHSESNYSSVTGFPVTMVEKNIYSGTVQYQTSILLLLNPSTTSTQSGSLRASGPSVFEYTDVTCFGFP